jgi:hypothetical protein
MYAIEFRTKIKNGVIKIPVEFWERLSREGTEDRVRVIVLTEEPAEVPRPDARVDFIAQLLADPLEIPDFIPLTRDEAHE